MPALFSALFSIFKLLCLGALVWAVFFVFPILILIAKRFLFTLKLERLCKNKGYELVCHRTNFATILTPQKGFDFQIRAGDQVYHIYWVSARNRFTEFCFLTSKELAIFRKFSINLIARRGKGLRGMGMLNTVDFGVDRKNMEVDLEAQAPKGENKLLLFYPVARDVTWIAPGKGKVFLGNGDVLFNQYRFFTRSGFFEELSSPGKYLRWTAPWKYE